MAELRDRVREHIVGLSDDQLVAYIVTGVDAYEPEAVDFAREEFQRRNIDPGVVERLENEATVQIEADRAARAEAAERSLDLFDICYAFFMGFCLLGILKLSVADALFQMAGETRKSAQMWKSAFAGVVCAVIVVLVAIVGAWAHRS